MVVLGLSPAAGTGSLLCGLTGCTGDTGEADNSDDLGEATADFGEPGPDGMVTAGALSVPNEGTGAAEGAALGWALTAASDFAPTTPASLETASVSSDSDSALVILAVCLCKVTAGFAFAASSSAEACAGFCDAALEIKEAAKTTPTVSKAERVKLIFSPKALKVDPGKFGTCGRHIVRCSARFVSASKSYGAWRWISLSQRNWLIFCCSLTVVPPAEVWNNDAELLMMLSKATPLMR